MPKPRLFGHGPKAMSDKRMRNGPLFNVVPEEGDNPAEIIMYGDIWESVPVDWWTGEPIEGMHIALDDMLERINGVKDASEIVIRLNSTGGDANAGKTIHNLLRSFPGKKTVIVEGMAASAGSLIMCAGDVIKVHPSSEVLIHNPASRLEGWYSLQDLRTLIGDYEACVKALKAVYTERTGKSDEELQEIIDASTWYVGQEIIDAGFADELIEPAYRLDPPEVVDDGEAVVVAGVKHHLYNLANVPAWLTGGDKGRREVIEDRAETTNKEAQVAITNADELRAAYPELAAQLIDKAVADAKASAVKSERERIRDIESIAATLDPELVNRAKYDEPMTAQDLAFAAIQAQAKAGAAILRNADRDREESGVCNVDPVPSDPDEDDPDEEEGKAVQSVINEAARLYNLAKPTKRA